MERGIIVVDIPESCKNIRGDKNGCPYGGMVCQINQEDVMQHVKFGSKPDWCPIHMMPDKLESNSRNAHEDFDYVCGWNDCLRKIEGKM